jgi:opacity protein-like surface antigen
MKKYSVFVLLVVSLLVCSVAQGAPPIFKEKKLFGPIPYNSFSLGVGFLDGVDFTYLTEHLNNWAYAHGKGYETFEELSPAPYGRLSYERQLTPNHFFKGSTTLSYINTSSVGAFIAEQPDTNYALTMERTLKVYLLTFEAGFSYCFIPPEPQRFSPYAGAGFAAVVPMVRLDTKCTQSDGSPFSAPEENASRNSFQAGLHMEFGMTYYITNRYAAGLEGRYQMAQSKFYIHGGNFDLKYAGFILSLNLIYYL